MTIPLRHQPPMPINRPRIGSTWIRNASELAKMTRILGVLGIAMSLTPLAAQADDGSVYFRQQLPHTMLVTGPKYAPISISLDALYQRRPGSGFVIPLEITGGDPSIRPSLRNAPVGLEIVNNGSGIAATNATLKGTFDIEVVKGDFAKPTKIQIQEISATIAARTDGSAKEPLLISPTAAGVFGEAQWSWASRPGNWPATLTLDTRTGTISGTPTDAVSLVGGQLRLQNSGDAAAALTSPFSITIDGQQCSTPWGDKLKHGEKIIYYPFEAPDYWVSCDNSRREATCSNGVIADMGNAYKVCTPQTEAMYAANAHNRAAKVRQAATDMVTAMRTVLNNGWIGCTDNSFCYLENVIVNRNVLPSYFSVSNKTFFMFLADESRGASWTVQSVVRYSRDNLQFNISDIRKSDCVELVRNPPAGLYLYSFNNKQQFPAELTTEAARVAYCNTTATGMSFFFRQ